MADNIFPRHAPHPTAVIGWDGTNFRVYRVDALGHLQIDVLTSGLPLGAATAANQALILARLQLIDDLTNALDSIDTDELVVNVDESVLPPLAATSTNQATLISRFQDQAFTYLTHYWDTVNTLNAVLNLNTLNLLTVPPGEVWVVTHFLAYCDTAALTQIDLLMLTGGVNYQLRRYTTVALDEEVTWTGHAYLNPGDLLRVNFWGCAIGDDLYAWANGYKMTRD